MRTWTLALIVSTGVAVAVAGCGVRGSLETPPSAKADKHADANSGQGKPEGGTGKPHRGFVLDGLLR